MREEYVVCLIGVLIVICGVLVGLGKLDSQSFMQLVMLVAGGLLGYKIAEYRIRGK